jgi:hypothetical protein
MCFSVCCSESVSLSAVYDMKSLMVLTNSANTIFAYVDDIVLDSSPIVM